VRLTEAGENKYEQVLRVAEQLLTGEQASAVGDRDYAPTRKIRQAQHRLTDVEIREIGEEYQAGMTIPEIANNRKINRDTASLALRRAGVPTRKVDLSPAQIAEAAGLYAEGWSLNRLGRRYGVDPKTMKKRLSVWKGLPRRA
jgi:hypothetical protein